MLSRHNQVEKERRASKQQDHFALRKLSIGVVSALIGIGFVTYGGQVNAHADQLSNENKIEQQLTVSAEATSPNNSDRQPSETVATNSTNANEQENTQGTSVTEQTSPQNTYVLRTQPMQQSAAPNTVLHTEAIQQRSQVQ